jgi:large subunit ribosomal protein L24
MRSQQRLPVAVALSALALTVLCISPTSFIAPGAPVNSRELRTGVSMSYSQLPSSERVTGSPRSLVAGMAGLVALLFAMQPRRQSASAQVVALSPITMFSRSPFPTTPMGSRGKRRIRAGRKRPIFRGRQISVRVNRATNKPIRYRMHVKTGDTVQVVDGKDAGKVTTILKVYPKWNKVLCLGVNFCIKHVRPLREDEVGQRVQVEAPMHSSSVMHYSEAEGVAGHLGIRFEKEIWKDGKVVVRKIRYNKATGERIYKKIAPKWVPLLERTE